jgi:hypothetical protein
MKRDYQRLPIEEFGLHLIDTGDLDPIYIALNKSSMPEDQRSRWLVAYWCFYSAGVASWMSEKRGEDFWQEMMIAAENTRPTPFGSRWDRGHERRHFRAAQATQPVLEMRVRYGARPEDMVREIGGPPSTKQKYKEVAARAQMHRGFGPWISYKIADMIDRLGVNQVEFGFDDAMYDNPRKAALMLYDDKHSTSVLNPATVSENDKISWSVDYLLQRFRHHTAPPLNERPIGLQEVETILCKWKSHLSGHYPLFNDIREITEGIHPWLPFCPSAKEFLQHMPVKP